MNLAQNRLRLDGLGLRLDEVGVIAGHASTLAAMPLMSD